VGQHIQFERGDVDAGFAAADLIHEATYTTHSQYPGYMEPMATVASLDPDGRLVLYTSTQAVNLVRMQVAMTLGLPISRVRVIQAATGGGFGGKIVEDDNQLLAGLLALHTQRPVRLVNNRLEDFQAACASVPERITLKLGMLKDGSIVAKQVRIIAECGAYAGLAGDVMHVSAMRSDNMHRNPNVRSEATLYYTNNPPRGAFRALAEPRCSLRSTAISTPWRRNWAWTRCRCTRSTRSRPVMSRFTAGISAAPDFGSA
jgi:CO/xanthine dehydrogenase Mo-binding subunit